MEGEGLISGRRRCWAFYTEVLDEADKAPIEVVVILKALVEATPAVYNVPMFTRRLQSLSQYFVPPF